MAAGPWVVTNEFATKLSIGQFLDGDSYKMALFLSTSNIGAGSTTYAGLTNEHANNNGYATGGVAVTLSRSGTTSLKIDATDVLWTASGGSIIARYAVIYEVGGNIVAYCLLDDTPADVTVVDGATLTGVIHANGIINVNVV